MECKTNIVTLKKTKRHTPKKTALNEDGFRSNQYLKLNDRCH
jgi:hypothetical protein